MTGRTFLQRMWLSAALLAMASVSAVAEPTPVITARATQGMAPFTVHVHALESGFGVGDQLSALIEWDFGDASGDYNTLVGFNAAHVYDSPGTYTVTLSITNEAGQKATATLPIVVTPDTRTRIYVSAAGNDANNGLSPATAIRTVSRAKELVQDNYAILFRRGDTFTLNSQMTLNHRNVVIGTYGSGARPTLRWTGSHSGYPAIIRSGGDTNGLHIEDLVFDDQFSPTPDSPRGIQPAGQNVTVRRCHFARLSYAMNGGSQVYGWLTLRNTAEVLGGYFVWGEGADHTHLGNVAAGSYNEHTIRIGGAKRVLIAHNDLTNLYKSAVWFMLGSDCYLAHNKIRNARVLIGPNFSVGGSSERFRRAVAEANEFFGEGFILYSGAMHTVLRNNVIRADAKECVSVWGYYEPMNRTVEDVRIYNNTGYNDSTHYGRFLKIGDGAVGVKVMNNLYHAPQLNSAYAGANVKSEGQNISTHGFRRNLWALPATGHNVHFVLTSGLTPEEWAALPQTDAEHYRAFSAGDLDASHVPQFAASIGLPIAGVHTDFRGNRRPPSQSWTVGAVELNPVDPKNPPPGSQVIVFNMEEEAGWNAINYGAQPNSDGFWERGVPAGGGRNGDPPTDYDGSGQCWLTGNRPGLDVNGGPMILLSPIIDVTGGDNNPSISYARWFYSQPNDDRLDVYISNDGGTSWVPVESVGHIGEWRVRTFRVADFVEPTSTVRLLFLVADELGNSITEAAIDDVRICLSQCPSPSQANADINGDGVVDVHDFLLVVQGWGVCAAPCSADLDGDGVVNINDLLFLIIQWH